MTTRVLLQMMGLAAAATLAVILTFHLVVNFIDFSGEKSQNDRFRSPSSPSILGKFSKAAVSCDGIPCSKVGRDVMLEGGNAVDAAVATLFCIGVVNPQSSGIGGGSMMTIYNSSSASASFLNAREMAPLAATEDMFHGDGALAFQGPLAIAIPGELAGSWAAHQAYGRLPWSRLVMPSARMAEDGVPVNKHLAMALKLRARTIKLEPSLWDFLNETTGQVLREGDLFYRQTYANTLYKIAEFGADVFYNGTIGQQLVEDMQKRGGIITEEDLIEYHADWVDPVEMQMQDNLTMYTSPLPGSGVLLAFILNILDGHLPRKSENQTIDVEDPLIYHRMTEAFKFAFAQRTNLGDPVFEPQVLELTKNLMSKEFASEIYEKIDDSQTSNNASYYGKIGVSPDDHGTSHISVIDGDGLAVSLTATTNYYFGAGFASEQTGIIVNNQMSDFSSPNITSFFKVPPSEVNFIKPGKRPLSSMAPTIVANAETGQVRMVIGSAGGTKISTGIAHAMIRNLWFGETIKEAIDSPRFHHQLFPMEFSFERGFPEDIVNNMSSKGHKTFEFKGGPTIIGITVEDDGFIYANSDYRKCGTVAGIDPVD